MPQPAGLLDVWAAADLFAPVADRIHLDLLAIALTEQADRAGVARLGHTHLSVTDRQIALDLTIDQRLDLGQLLGAELLGVREIEAQPLGGDVAAALRHM